MVTKLRLTVFRGIFTPRHLDTNNQILSTAHDAQRSPCAHRLLHNISLCLFRSVNTLNSKLKSKTILINKSQLLLKALYFEATLTFLRFAAKHCSISSTLRRSSSAIRSYMLHIPNSAEGNCLTGNENHTLCLKSDIKSINLRIIVKVQSWLGPHCFSSFSKPFVYGF